jgi:aspartate ammonia-lyase
MARYAESSAAVVTALNPVLGYERAAEVAKRAVAERRAVSEIVREEGLLDDEALAEVLDVLAMTRGGLAPTSRGGLRPVAQALKPRPGSRRRPADPPPPG